MRALGLRVDALRVVGGGARNALWRQVLADALAAPVVQLAEPEAGALGAAIQAAWTVRRLAGETVSCDDVAARCVHETGEVVAPDPARAAAFRDLGERFRAAVRGLHGDA
jgi:sugar (pentulose or hexulose) kinase